jgi:hypothetical protein
MIHTIQNLKTLNLNPDFEFQQLLGSLKHVINIIMRIRDMECYKSPPWGPIHPMMVDRLASAWFRTLSALQDKPRCPLDGSAPSVPPHCR